MGKSVLTLKMRGLVLVLCLVGFAATEDGGHFDSPEDTIPGHPGSPRFTVPICANMPAFMLNSDRIVGGVDAPSMIPWQVSVRSGTFTFCGATILDASTILCAAHCFYQSSASGKSIRAGSTQKSSGGQIRNIASIVWNTNAGQTYNSGTLDNDFVILKLESPLQLNADVQPACLPSSDEYLDVSSTEERCFTSGGNFVSWRIN